MGSFTPSLPSGASGTLPSMTSVSGARSTSNVGASAAMRDVQEAMLTHKPYQTPILTRLLSSKSGKKPTGNQKFEWVYRTLLPRTDTVTITGGATSEDNITVGDSTLYQVGTKFVVDSTGEVVVVDSIASSQIDITKLGSGNITAAASATIHFLGDVFEQGSSSATAKSVNKNFEYNYCEIFKRAVHETRSQRATIEYGPEDWNDNKMARMEEIKYDIEQNFLHGIRDSETGFQNGSHTQFFAGGVFDSTANFISATYAYTDPLTEDTFFQTFLKGAYQQGSNEKTLYAGNTLLVYIQEFAKDVIRTAPKEKVYGVSLTRIEHAFGVLNLVWHPMLEGTIYGKKGILLDDQAGYVKYRYLAGNGENRDLQFEEFEFVKEQDSRKGQFIAEMGMQIEGNPYHDILEPS